MEVAKTLSFTRAATNLYITQQACSKYVASLEKELGFPLFTRSTRRVQLTEEGEQVSAVFSHFKQEYDAVVTAARKTVEERDHCLCLGIMAATSPSLLTQSFSQLFRLYPKLHLNWQYGDPSWLASMVASRQLDAALIYQEAVDAHDDLCWMQLVRLQPQIILATHLISEPGVSALELLYSLPFGACAHYKKTLREGALEAENLLQIMKLPYSGIRVFESVDELLVATELGECFTIANRLLPIYYSPYLAKIPVKYEASLVCAWHPKNKNKYLSIILDHLRKQNHMQALIDSHMRQDA